MARNEEKGILVLEREVLGYSGAENQVFRIEIEPANKFRWITDQLPTDMIASPAERRRLRKEISKRTKELADVVREKHIQHNLPFRCIDDYDECVAKRKKQKKSPYLCSLALYICLANSMKALLVAIAAAAGAGGLLR